MLRHVGWTGVGGMTLPSWFAISALILARQAGRGSRQPGRQRKKGVALPGSLAVFTGSVLGHLSINPFQWGLASGAHPQSHPSCPPPQGTFLEQSLQSTHPGLAGDVGKGAVPCPLRSCPWLKPSGGVQASEEDLVLVLGGCLGLPAAPGGPWGREGWE